MFSVAYCNRNAPMPASIGVANEVPDFHATQLLFVSVSHILVGQDDSIASPIVAKLSSELRFPGGLNTDGNPLAVVEWTQITLSCWAGNARFRIAPLLEAAAKTIVFLLLA